jgi:hypothetical protein
MIAIDPPFLSRPNSGGRIKNNGSQYPSPRNLLLTPDVSVQEQEPRSGVVMLGTILLIILIVILIGALPTWPYSGGWGYYPSGGSGLLVLIVIILLLMGRI